jgi:hypothetical protein
MDVPHAASSLPKSHFSFAGGTLRRAQFPARLRQRRWLACLAQTDGRGRTLHQAARLWRPPCSMISSQIIKLADRRYELLRAMTCRFSSQPPIARAASLSHARLRGQRADASARALRLHRTCFLALYSTAWHGPQLTLCLSLSLTARPPFSRPTAHSLSFSVSHRSSPILAVLMGQLWARWLHHRCGWATRRSAAHVGQRALICSHTLTCWRAPYLTHVPGLHLPLALAERA